MEEIEFELTDDEHGEFGTVYAGTVLVDEREQNDRSEGGFCR